MLKFQFIEVINFCTMLAKLLKQNTTVATIEIPDSNFYFDMG